MKKCHLTNFKKQIAKQIKQLKNKGLSNNQNNNTQLFTSRSRSQSIDNARNNAQTQAIKKTVHQLSALTIFGWKDANNTLISTILADYYEENVTHWLNNMLNRLSADDLYQQQKYAMLSNNQGDSKPLQALINRVKEWIQKKHNGSFNQELLAFLTNQQNTALLNTVINSDNKDTFHHLIKDHLTSLENKPNRGLGKKNLAICMYCAKNDISLGLAHFLLAKHHEKNNDLYPAFLKIASDNNHPNAMYEFAINLDKKSKHFNHINTDKITPISLFANVMASNDTETKVKVLHFIENAKNKDLNSEAFYHRLRKDSRPQIQETLGLMYLDGGLFLYDHDNKKEQKNLYKIEQNIPEGIRYIKLASETQKRSAFMLSRYHLGQR